MPFRMPMSVSVKSGRVEWLDILAPVSGHYTRHVANPRLLHFSSPAQ